MNKQEKKYIRDLHKTKTRRLTGCCVVEGLRAVTTFLLSRHTLRTLYITEKAHANAYKDLTQYPYTIITDTQMLDISAAQTPSGILAIFEINHETLPLGPGIVCAQLQDPGNMGTLIRTAAACGRKTIICVEGVDPWSHKVIQASAGTIAQVDVYEYSWQQLKKQVGILPLYALVTRGGHQPTSKHADGLFVVGNEANGIPNEWIGECDELITLSMPGNTESLNAAVAGSIALYLTLT